MNKMKHTVRKVACLLTCCMACLPVINSASLQASAVNLHDELFMSEEEKMIKEYCDIAVNQVNNERLALGLSELKTFPKINEVACVRAEELTSSFSHNRPDGSICFSILKENQIKYGRTAENIAAGRADPVSTIQQFMASEGHRANILGESYTHIGIGYYHLPGTQFEYYWGMFLIASYDGQEEHIFDDQYIPERTFGDTDGSHEINAADAKLIMHYAASRAAGIEIMPATDFLTAADINADGHVDAIDASIILEYSAARGAGGADIQLTNFVW